MFESVAVTVSPNFILKFLTTRNLQSFLKEKKRKSSMLL